MLTDDALGIYIHVPFCRSKCRYCDFCSHPPLPGEMDRYAAALQAEIRLRASDQPARTVYFGGGTPSFLGATRLCGLLTSLEEAFRFQPDCEITVEANPADVTVEWLSACRAAGVNRLSLGVQAMRDEDLRFLGRRHTVTQAITAAQRARDAGFVNLGIDLIAGLPEHTSELTRRILAEAIKQFAPEHVSCYQLTVAPGTPLHESIACGDVRMPDSDTEARIFMATHETLGALGYEGYEVSNFARTRAHRSRHNSAYWTHRDYLGLGPSAHSFLNPVRSWNAASLEEYCASLERGELPLAGQERLTDTQRASEIVLLGLRTRDGFSLEELKRDCGIDLLAEKSAVMQHAELEGLIRHNAGRVQPTLKGLAIADRLAVDLVPEKRA